MHASSQTSPTPWACLNEILFALTFGSTNTFQLQRPMPCSAVGEGLHRHRPSTPGGSTTGIQATSIPIVPSLSQQARCAPSIPVPHQAGLIPVGVGWGCGLGYVPNPPNLRSKRFRKLLPNTQVQRHAVIRKFWICWSPDDFPAGYCIYRRDPSSHSKGETSVSGPRVSRKY